MAEPESDQQVIHSDVNLRYLLDAGDLSWHWKEILNVTCNFKHGYLKLKVLIPTKHFFSRRKIWNVNILQC